jgi:hypothetical protein
VLLGRVRVFWRLLIPSTYTILRSTTTDILVAVVVILRIYLVA